MRLDERACVIAGAAGGMGSAIARGFAKEGGSVVLSDVNLAGIERVAEEIRAEGGEAETVQADVTNLESMRAVVRRAVDRFGRLDVVTNTVGIAGFAPIEDITREQFDKVMAVNVYGVFVCVQAAFPVMRSQGRGKIISISSLAGKIGFAEHAIYTASKHAVDGITRALSRELAPYGITVNAISPGIVATDYWEQLRPEYERRGRLVEGQSVLDLFSGGIPLERLQLASDVVGIALYMGSDESDYMTGQCVSVDGGMA